MEPTTTPLLGLHWPTCFSHPLIVPLDPALHKSGACYKVHRVLVPAHGWRELLHDPFTQWPCIWLNKADALLSSTEECATIDSLLGK